MKLYNWNEIAETLERHGVSYRQFDHWSNRDMLGFFEHPGGSGYRRDVPWAIVVRACVMGDLIGMGFTVAAASRIAGLLITKSSYDYISRELALHIEVVLEEEPT